MEQQDDMTTPAVEVEQPAVEQEQAPEQTQEEQQAEAKARRAVRLMASEIELPDFDDTDIELPEEARQRVRERLEAFYAKAEEVAGQLNRGVDSKFKEAAAARQQIEAERQAIAEWRQQQEALVNSDAEAVALWQELKQYENVNWYEQINNAPDPETKQRIRDLKDYVEDKQKKLSEATARSRFIRQQEMQQQAALEHHVVEVGEQILKSRYKDWGPKAKETVIKSMQEDFGIGRTHPALDAEAIRAVTRHPGLVAALYEAALYRQSKKAAVSESQKQQEAPAPKPVSRVGGNATVARDPDKMSTEEWLRWRNTQLRKK